MKAVAMKFREKKFRSFYRINVLPLHIPNRKGAVKKLMEEELAEHLEAVEANGLQAELEAYTNARNLRQDTYDAVVAAEAEASRNPSAEAGNAVVEAKLAFTEAKLDFTSNYQ